MNKTQLKSKCKEILNSYPIGKKLNIDDFNFLLSVFENHPEWALKKGVGIKDITVRYTQYRNKNKCFYLERIDNTITDISYLRSIDSYSDLHFIKMACRTAISPIIQEFKNSLDCENLYCEFTKEKLHKTNMHIDHYDLTFNELVEKWLAITKQDLSVNETKDDDVVTCFKSLDTIEEFKKFHNENTHLRPVSKEANLSILRKK
jgi:hypothetical protein